VATSRVAYWVQALRQLGDQVSRSMLTRAEFWTDCLRRAEIRRHEARRRIGLWGQYSRSHGVPSLDVLAHVTRRVEAAVNGLSQAIRERSLPRTSIADNDAVMESAPAIRPTESGPAADNGDTPLRSGFLLEYEEQDFLTAVHCICTPGAQIHANTVYLSP